MPQKPTTPPTPRDLAAETVREVWRLTAITWKIFCAALLPLRLANLRAALPRLLAHLHKYRPKRRLTSLEHWAENWLNASLESLG